MRSPKSAAPEVVDFGKVLLELTVGLDPSVAVIDEFLFIRAGIYLRKII